MVTQGQTWAWWSFVVTLGIQVSHASKEILLTNELWYLNHVMGGEGVFVQSSGVPTELIMRGLQFA